MSRILLVEDDEALARGLVALLQQNGYEVDDVTTGKAALAHQAVGDYSAMILDLSLPDISGFEVLNVLRGGDSRPKNDAASRPVLILTARSALDDRVRGLDLGADDYLLKPFEPAELLARLRALMRRAHGAPAPTITIGKLMFDHASRAFYVGGKMLDLPRRERAVLEQLVVRAGKVVQRATLLDVVFGMDAHVGDNALEVYIGRIRKRLGPGGPQIRTVRGLGYMIETE